MIALEALKKHKNYEKIRVKLSTEELDLLANRIYEYTIKLAKDNSIELTDKENRMGQKSENAIIKLQRYLQIQKKIFKAVA